MKKILTLVAVAASMVACGPKQVTTTVTGNASGAEDGTAITLIDGYTLAAVDTAYLKDGAFSFTITGTEAAPYSISGVNFYTDGEAVNVTLTNEERSVSGTPLTDAIGAFYKQMKESSVKLNEFRTKRFEGVDMTDQEAAKKANDDFYAYYRNVYIAKNDSVVNALFAANKTTLLGPALFLQTISGDTIPDIQQIDEYIKLYPTAGKFAQITRQRTVLENVEKTSAGKMFTDFTVRNFENTADAKLSDYVGKGKYVLVDFWASWCGPCIAEIPNLKAVQEKFGGDKFTVLGVNVWDEHAKALASVEEKGTTWPQIFDADNRNSTATLTYGVQGIPTIILFGPDGKIIDRTVRGARIMEIVSEYLSK